MPSEELPEPETGPATNSEEQDRSQAEEAADFITSQVLDKGATFFEG